MNHHRICNISNQRRGGQRHPATVGVCPMLSSAGWHAGRSGRPAVVTTGADAAHSMLVLNGDPGSGG